MNHRALYEAKTTMSTVTSHFGFDIIDHEHNVATPHLVGHTEETRWDTLLLDKRSSFAFDGEDKAPRRHLRYAVRYAEKQEDNIMIDRLSVDKQRTPTPREPHPVKRTAK